MPTTPARHTLRLESGDPGFTLRSALAHGGEAQLGEGLFDGEPPTEPDLCGCKASRVHVPPQVTVGHVVPNLTQLLDPGGVGEKVLNVRVLGRSEPLELPEVVVS